MGAFQVFVVEDRFLVATAARSVKDEAGFARTIMSNRNNIHVVPHGDNWAVRREGSERASKVVETQREAIEWARPVSRREEGELFIHRPNGQIRDRDSHGNDPRSSKG